MAYKGLVTFVQLGTAGMYTDDAPSNVPVTNLINCRNCIIDNGSVLNEPGSIRWNKTQTYYNVNGSPVLDGTGIVALFDWYPEQDLQYTIVVTRLGKVYRFQNQWEYVEITANQTAIDTNGEYAPEFLSVTDSVTILQCGQESAGLPRKLFIFTGQSQVQVVSGTNTTRTNISHPPIDWQAGNYPQAGILYNGRVFAWGNPNFPHNVYASDNTYNPNSSAITETTTPSVSTDTTTTGNASVTTSTSTTVTTVLAAAGCYGNEDFVSDPFNINVTNIFPGEGQKVVAAFNYQGRLQVVKYPRGLFYLNLVNPVDPTTWYYAKLNDSIGTTSPHAVCGLYDDYWMMNNVSSITSMAAALTLGQLTTADILKQAKVSSFFANIISPLGIGVRQAIFNSQNKKAYFLTRKSSFDVAQRDSVFENPQTNPPIVWDGNPLTGNNEANAGENLNSMMIVFDFSSETQKIMYSDKDQANVLALIKSVIGLDELYIGSEDGYIYKANQANRGIKWPPPEGQISLAIPTGAGNVPSGTYAYGISFLSFPPANEYTVSFASGSSSLTLGGSGYSLSNVVQFSGSGVPSPLLTGIPYYPLGLTGSLLQVASSVGGAAMVPGASGSGYVTFGQESVLGAFSTNLQSNPVPTSFPTGTALYAVSACTLTGSQKVDLTNIPLASNPNVSARNLYRYKVIGTSGAPSPVYQLMTTINDNTTTSYVDNNATVGSQVPPFLSQDGFTVPYLSEFQTPHMDLTQTDIMTQSIIRADKNYDFLELQYLPTTASNVSVDIYVDGNYSQTQSFYLGKAPQLDSAQLNGFRLQGLSVRSQRLPIVGRGRTISFRAYSSTQERIFNVTGFFVYFRMAGQADKK